MDIVGQILLYLGCFAVWLGYLGILFCGFAVSFGRGLLTVFVPFVGFGTALRRFPWLLWLWLGGVAFIMIGALLT